MTCTNVILAQPQAGATVDYTIPEGDSARLSFGPEDIQGININQEGALVISFADGGTLNIANFQQLVDGGNLLYLADGTLVDPKLLQSGLASGLTAETANDNDMVIAIPSEGVVREITLEPSQNYIFAFDMTAPKKAEQVDGKFVMSFDNGSQIVLTNYAEAMSAAIPPSISMESKICTFTNKELVTAIEELAMGPVVEKEVEEEIVQSKLARKAQPTAEDVANIEPAAGDEPSPLQLAQIEPAAGEAAAVNGGRFYSTPGSEPLGSINAIGPLGRTQLPYEAPTFEQNSFIPQAINSIPNAGAFISTVDETNLDNGNLVTTGFVTVDFGSDGPATPSNPNNPVNPFQPNGNVDVGCSVAGGVLSVQGQPVTINAVANGYEGVLADGTVVFTFEINPTTGAYTYTQIEAFDHADAADPDDDICLTFPILVTDYDGDTATTTVTIYVLDDAPVAENDVRTLLESETITGNILTNDDMSEDTPNTLVSITYNGTTYDFTGAAITIPAQWGTLTINPDGTYSYTAKSNNPDGTDVFTYVLRDFDGDRDPADLIISVSPIDDQPIVTTPVVETVDETNLATPGLVTRDGTLTANFGTDGPGTFAGTNTFNATGSIAGGNLTSNGNLVNVSFDPATGTYTGTANGTTVFTLVIAANGDYSFQLFEQLDHADGTNPNDSITLNFGFEAEDADGDTTPGTITVNVLDDAPVISSSQLTVDETDLGPIVANGTVAHDFGEDGRANFDAIEGSNDFTFSGSARNNALTSQGQAVTVTYNDATNTYTGASAAGTVFTLLINSDGSYTFTLLRPLDHADPNDPNDIINLDFGVVITDYDGDTSENTIRIRVQDDVPTIGDAEGGVDETNFDQGNLVFSDVLDHNFGLDLGSITPNGTVTSTTPLLSHGAAVTVTQTANGYTGTANGQTVFTLTINPATGAYTYTQFRDLDHPNANDHNDVIAITFPVQVVADDGESDTGSIVIKVYDDGPAAHDDINGAEEGQSITGNVTDNDDFSQDDPNTVVTVRHNGTDYPITAGTPAVITTPLGTLTLRVDGSYTYVATNIGDPDGTDVFTYTLRDRDGDRDTATLSIRVTPDGEPVAVDQSLAVDETNLTPGPMIFNGDLNVDFGVDGPGANGVSANNNSFAFSGSVLGGNLTSSGSPVTVALAGNTFTGTAADGRQIFTLQINADGTYRFQLFDHIDHADATNPNDIIKLSFGVTVTDADGDTAQGRVVIEVYDDAPVARDDGAFAVLESATVSGNVLTNDELSEDNPNYVTAIRFGGNTVAIPQDAANSSISIIGQYGTLTINRLGDYSYTARSDNPQGTDTFTYSLQDFDGDIDTAEIKFEVSKINDLPIVVNGNDLVDETNLRFNVPVVETGTIVVNFGGDGPGVIGGTGTFDSSGFRVNNTLSSNGLPVTVTFNAATNTYTGATTAGTVFTLVIDADGDYTFRLFASLDHSDPNNDNEEIYLHFGIKGTDIDNDIGTGTLTVTVLDDVPVIGNSAITVDETNFGTTISGTGTVGYDFGQDGVGSVVGNGNFNVTGGTALTSGGQAINVVQTAGGYEGRVGTTVIFSLTINPTTGAYTYTQFDQIDHPNASNPDDVLTLNFGVRVTEGDGDTANGFVSVNVRDDGPDAVNDARTVAEGGDVITGNVTSNDDVGADSPGRVTTVRFNGTDYPIAAGGDVTINGTYGRLVISSTGAYTYTTNNSNLNGTDTFTYTLRDFDGDTDTANLAIFVEPDAEPVVVNAVETVDETNLNITETGTVSVNYGGDGPGTIAGTGAFNPGGSLLGGALTHNGVAVNVTFNAANGTYTGAAGGTTVFTLVVGSNGAYTYRQFEQLDHANGSDPNDSITLTFGVRATDSDGDVGNGSIIINVLDDAPRAANDSAGTLTTGQTASGNVLSNDSWGQDNGSNARITSVTFAGQTVAVPASGWTAWIPLSNGWWTVASFRIHSNGTYELQGAADGTYQATYTIRDHDGDTATATITAGFVSPPPPPPPPWWGDGGGGDGGGGDGGGGDGCPLVFDLNGDGITLTSKADSGILFDIDEDGIADRTAWVGADDAILVLDKNEDGTVNDHSEMFGNNEIGGYEMLSSYDSNGDGVIDANDEIWSKLQLWQDLNQDGISQANELFTLDQAGFAAINLAVRDIAEVIAGNNVTTQGEVTMADGSTIYGYDAWFKYDSGAGKSYANVDGTVKQLIEAISGDTVYGDNGADNFLFDTIGEVAQINGFNAAEGDSLDLSLILEGQDDVTNAINDFVFARVENGSTIISVDVDGANGPAVAMDIAKLDGVTGLEVTEMLENKTIVL